MGIVTPTMVIGEAVAGAAAALRAELESIITKVNTSAFDIGDLLHLIKVNKYYYGYNTFQEYVATLKIRPRKAQYLRRIAEVMEFLSIPRETYEPVGVSKLREITSLDPAGEWLDDVGVGHPLSGFILGMIEKHQELTLDQIKAHVKTLKGLVGDNAMVRRGFWVSQLVADETIDPAVELARKQIGSTHKDDEGISQDAKDGACWEVIAIGFLLDPANSVLGGEEFYKEQQ
jgi:hypothetical protein